MNKRYDLIIPSVSVFDLHLNIVSKKKPKESNKQRLVKSEIETRMELIMTCIIGKTFEILEKAAAQEILPIVPSCPIPLSSSKKTSIWKRVFKLDYNLTVPTGNATAQQLSNKTHARKVESEAMVTIPMNEYYILKQSATDSDQDTMCALVEQENKEVKEDKEVVKQVKDKTEALKTEEKLKEVGLKSEAERNTPVPAAGQEICARLNIGFCPFQPASGHSCHDLDLMVNQAADLGEPAPRCIIDETVQHVAKVLELLVLLQPAVEHLLLEANINMASCLRRKMAHVPVEQELHTLFCIYYYPRAEGLWGLCKVVGLDVTWMRALESSNCWKQLLAILPASVQLFIMLAAAFAVCFAFIRFRKVLDSESALKAECTDLSVQLDYFKAEVARLRTSGNANHVAQHETRRLHRQVESLEASRSNLANNISLQNMQLAASNEHCRTLLRQVQQGANHENRITKRLEVEVVNGATIQKNYNKFAKVTAVQMEFEKFWKRRLPWFPPHLYLRQVVHTVVVAEAPGKELVPRFEGISAMTHL
ncbi:hypothetical protein BDR26DRAFT_970221 [Obelidium mucronatum]|nr:hypothetical protein BDR26DRAFT_970221 [Obelidium mucronatum]